MKAVSLFSGVGGFELGLERAGIETILQVENDPWCLSVLERHWPAVQRVDDVRSVGRESVHSVFSGKAAQGVPPRAKGSDGQALVVQTVCERTPAAESNQVQQPRTAASLESEDEIRPDAAAVRDDADGSGWTMQHLREANAATQGRPRPLNGTSAGSALSSLQYQARGDRAAGIHGTSPALSGDNVIDLVYGGWPCQGNSVAGQRAGLSDERSGLWHEVRRVLRELRPRWFVGENVPGLFSVNQGRDFLRVLMDLDELGYGVAWRTVDARFFGVAQRRRRVFIVGCLGDAHRAAQVLAVCESCGGYPAARREEAEDVAFTLDDGARGTSVDLPMTVVGSSIDEDSARALLAKRGYHGDFETENFVVASTFNGGQVDDVAPSLVSGDGPHGRSVGHNGMDVVVAGALRASDGHHGHSSPRGDGADNLIAFQPNSSRTDEEWRVDQSPPVKKGSGGNGAVPLAISGSMGVRRLTPLECERLQGWGDDHTRYTSDGKEIPDSHRYRMIGNGVVATVAEWIGHRLVWVDTERLRCG